MVLYKRISSKISQFRVTHYAKPMADWKNVVDSKMVVSKHWL